ncbi:hypothetical protein FRD01_14630 [Microvenator marinus]|uniref:Uncharacterized protein n=1 Tax=Microvenator marinus TaxID=2600177 RepID=A0A5B8XU61_9DELT|nr:hypothetical protein [Microvenator marinus]QED28448.1 hypothetical protein FRD01_14630 [Microvenator marinus]
MLYKPNMLLGAIANIKTDHPLSRAKLDQPTEELLEILRRRVLRLQSVERIELELEPFLLALLQHLILDKDDAVRFPAQNYFLKHSYKLRADDLWTAYANEIHPGQATQIAKTLRNRSDLPSNKRAWLDLPNIDAVAKAVSKSRKPLRDFIEEDPNGTLVRRVAWALFNQGILAHWSVLGEEDVRELLRVTPAKELDKILLNAWQNSGQKPANILLENQTFRTVLDQFATSDVVLEDPLASRWLSNLIKLHLLNEFWSEGKGTRREFWKDFADKIVRVDRSAGSSFLFIQFPKFGVVEPVNFGHADVYGTRIFAAVRKTLAENGRLPPKVEGQAMTRISRMGHWLPGAKLKLATMLEE